MSARIVMSALSLVLLAWSTAACDPQVGGQPSTSPIGTLVLPTLAAVPLATGDECSSASLGPGLRLAGSPTEGVYATSGENRVPIQWPEGGYVAAFTPELMIRSPFDGSVVAVAGEDLGDGRLGNLFVCVMGSPDARSFSCSRRPTRVDGTSDTSDIPARWVTTSRYTAPRMGEGGIDVDLVA